MPFLPTTTSSSPSSLSTVRFCWCYCVLVLLGLIISEHKVCGFHVPSSYSRFPPPSSSSFASSDVFSFPSSSSTALSSVTSSSSSSSGRDTDLHHDNNATNANNEDSIEQYTRDVTKVLKDLRKSNQDPGIPRMFREAPLPSFTNTWTLDDWKRHTSRWRYLDFIRFFPRSRLLRRILPQLFILLSWSTLVCSIFAKGEGSGVLHRVSLPLTPLSLVSTFVAALLTLRSNQGLDRLNMGRLAFGKVVLYTREMASLIVAYIYPENPYLAIKMLRHISLFGWLLKNFLRGEQVNGNDHDIIYTMLEPHDAEYVIQQRKLPMAVVTRMRQIFKHLSRQHLLGTAEELALDHTTAELNGVIMMTERIVATPIPPVYTSHTGRLLMFYLFFLPLALRGSGMLNGLGTVLTTFAVGFSMLGLDEISFLLEQPFKLMPLWQLCKNSMMDVSDCLVIQPPPLVFPNPPPLASSSNNVTTTTTSTTTNSSNYPKPPYW